MTWKAKGRSSTCVNALSAVTIFYDRRMTASGDDLSHFFVATVELLVLCPGGNKCGTSGQGPGASSRLRTRLCRGHEGQLTTVSRSPW